MKDGFRLEQRKMLVGLGGAGRREAQDLPSQPPGDLEAPPPILLPCDVLDPSPERRHKGHHGTWLSPMRWTGERGREEGREGTFWKAANICSILTGGKKKPDQLSI